MALAHERRERIVGRLAVGLVARHDLDLAPFQARGHLQLIERDTGALSCAQRLCDLGLGDSEQPQRVASVRGGLAQQRLQRLGLHGVAPQRLKLSRGAGEDDDRGAGPPRRRDHEARGGAHGAQHGGAGGDRGLLAVACAQRLAIEVRPALGKRGEDLGDALLQLLVVAHLAPLEATDDLRREVVGSGTETAARDDEVNAQAVHEAQRGLNVRGSVADDHAHREIHAQLRQAICEPRSVAVAHPPAEHLGARDDYAGARAHAQVGSLPGASGRRPEALVIA